MIDYVRRIRSRSRMLLYLFAAIAFAIGCWYARTTGDPWQTVCAISFSPNSHQLAVGVISGTFYNGKLHWEIGNVKQLVAIFNGDERGDPTVVFDKTYDGTWAGSPSRATGRFAVILPSENALACGCWDGKVMLVDLATRRLKTERHTDCRHVTALAISDKRHFVVASCGDATVLWRTGNSGLMRTVETRLTPGAIAISADGDLVAVADMTGTIELWNATTETRHECVSVSTAPINCLRFSPKGQVLAIGSGTSIILWDAGRHMKVLHIECTGSIDIDFSPDGRVLASAGIEGIRLWNAETGTLLGAFEAAGTFQSVGYSHDGKLIAGGDDSGQVIVWDTDTRARRWSSHLTVQKSIPLASVILGITGLLLLGISLVLDLVWWREGIS
jgi:WD40 repeat protein